MPDPVIRLVIPNLPPEVLSPNAGGMYNPRRQAQRRKAVAAARNEVHAMALAQRPRGKPLARATVTVTFWVPDRRPRDKGNLIGAFKPYLDGLKDAGLIADDAWQVIDEVYEVEYHKGDARIVIEVSDEST